MELDVVECDRSRSRLSRVAHRMDTNKALLLRLTPAVEGSRDGYRLRGATIARHSRALVDSIAYPLLMRKKTMYTAVPLRANSVA